MRLAMCHVHLSSLTSPCCLSVCVQLYRVNVLLQSPDSLDLSSKPPFFVLRRYSQFRQLHTEVRAALTSQFRQECSCICWSVPCPVCIEASAFDL
jgi:hypothetical protein